jgi:glycosyltransferase involved in cell wall biosynthesis
MDLPPCSLSPKRRRLRIGLDVSWLGVGCGGIRTWTRRIAAALVRNNTHHQFSLIWPYRSPPTEDALALQGSAAEMFTLGPGGLLQRIVRKLGLLHEPTRSVVGYMRQLDVIHWNLNTENQYPWLHLLPEVPKIVTLFDATIATVPECHTSFTVCRWTEHFNRIRELKSVWLTISESARDDLVRHCGVDPNKGRVIYPGNSFIDPEGKGPSATAGPPDHLGLNGSPYILSVGTIEPRKNHLRLLRAFRQLVAQPRFAGWKLVLVGPEGWKCANILADLRRTPGVIWAGILSHEELAATYRHAAVFAYPSLYEGFGLPVVEAMSFGLPVVTSNVSSLPEAAGTAGLLVDPHDESALRAALERLMADPEERRRRGEAGREYARQFSWDRSARQVMDAYEHLAAQRRNDYPEVPHEAGVEAQYLAPG